MLTRTIANQFNKESCELPYIRSMTEGMKIVKLKTGSIPMSPKTSFNFEKYIRLAKIYTPNENPFNFKAICKRPIQGINNPNSEVGKMVHNIFSKTISATAKGDGKRKDENTSKCRNGIYHERKPHSSEVGHNTYRQTLNDFNEQGMKINDLLKRPNNFTAKERTQQLSSPTINASKTKPQLSIRKMSEINKRAIVIYFSSVENKNTRGRR